MVKKEKFLSIIFKKQPSTSTFNALTDVLKGLIGNYIEPILKNNSLVVFFNSELEVDFKEVISALNDDMSISMCLYESSVLYSGIDKNCYAEFVDEKYLDLLGLNKLYVNESELIKNNIYNDVVVKNIFKEFYMDFNMLNVIKTYLDCNMNISNAALELFMHRNTVMNKIDKFIKVTGYDIKKFSNAYIIYKFL